MTIKKINYKIIFVCIIILFTVSCKDYIYENYKLFNKNNWNVKDVKKFEYSIKDTTAIYNIYIELENTKNYQYSNIFLFATITTPQNKIIIDTLQAFLFDFKGKAIGDKRGKDKYRNRFFYKRNVKFPAKGKYKVNLIHGMRDLDLKEITSIKFIVEKK